MLNFETSWNYENDIIASVKISFDYYNCTIEEPEKPNSVPKKKMIMTIFVGDI